MVHVMTCAEVLGACCARRRTYMTLIGQGKGRTRLQQVMDWCGGPDFDGPLIFDEVRSQTGSPRLKGCMQMPRHGAT